MKLLHLALVLLAVTGCRGDGSTELDGGTELDGDVAVDVDADVDCDAGPEECDGIDNDCDGYIDEQQGGGPLLRDCSNDCGPGEEECQDATWTVCSAPQPTEERCNGFDDDCDGEVDEDCI